MNALLRMNRAMAELDKERVREYLKDPDLPEEDRKEIEEFCKWRDDRADLIEATIRNLMGGIN